MEAQVSNVLSVYEINKKTSRWIVDHPRFLSRVQDKGSVS